MPAYSLHLPRTYSTWRPARRALHPVAALWTLIANWIERSRQRSVLAELDDHMLRDVGITRVEAATECGKPFWR